MKKSIIIAFLFFSINAFSYITIRQNEEQVGSTGWLRVTENFKTDGPGNCIFELICTEPGKMTCAFIELDPNNTTGCVQLVYNGSNSTGNTLNDVCKLVNDQIALGTNAGTIVSPTITVLQSGITEQSVITYSREVSAITGEKATTIKVYSYSEAHGLGII